MDDPGRLLRPKSIAVVGGGAWCANVIRECRKIGFPGAVWPVHPSKASIEGLAAFASVEDLPGCPDASFIGVNRQATVDVVAALARAGAGGAVAFASGFREAESELADGGRLEADMLAAAGDMPVLGPNCYGFLNLLDGVALWPDQHGAVPVKRGVAVIAQSSNIAINLTMQARALPLAYVMTVGNQAMVDMAGIGMALLRDPRVTALGLYVEGIRDLAAFEALAALARDLGKSIVAMKVGASEQAQAATVSHTASMAGSDAAAAALFSRLGIARVASFSAFLETLKVLHVVGPLKSDRIGSMSCSGGEASLVADLGLGRGLSFPPLDDVQRMALAEALGPKVALANPLDYHTYIWGNGDALAACFTAMMQSDLALGMVVLDFPRSDRCDRTEWERVIDAVAAAREASGVPMAIVASLPENLPEDLAERIMDKGLVPLVGLDDALAAIEAAAWLGRERVSPLPLLQPGAEGPGVTLSEAEAKMVLAAQGLVVPLSRRASSPEAAGAAAAEIGFPVVLKGEGVAHKTEAGAVVLGLANAASVAAAAGRMAASAFLVEARVNAPVAEILVGVTLDPSHGYVLTLGAGGTLAEVLQDRTSLLLPVRDSDVLAALDRLGIAPVLRGYRGAAAADVLAIAQAVMAVQDYVVANAGRVLEVEVNPLMVLPDRAVAVDALIRLKEME